MNSKKKNENKNTSSEKGQIVIYTAKNGQAELEVKLEKETVWLTQKQIADLFSIDRSVITKHIRNIFKEKELDENSVCAIFAHTAEDNKTYNTKFYNLDTVISVGYRVNSKQATEFRIWATKTLRDYLIQGYAVNQKRLLEQTDKLKELQAAISFIQNKANHPELQNQAQELLKIINEYSSSLTLLYQYDEGKLSIGKGKKPSFVLTHKYTEELIEKLKSELIKKGEASGLFGQDVSGKLGSIIAAVYQTFDRQELYPSIEEKAANLLYLVIKDHPFSDGNKRIGSLLFVYFLKRNNYLMKDSERKITDTTLVALVLLVATSDPKEKEVMIKIVTNLLKG
jgi:death-on-curing family protein